jgi:hypothetical protein
MAMPFLVASFLAGALSVASPCILPVDRAIIGIDGNCGFALLGENLQEGEAEFVEVPGEDGERSQADRETWAATKALRNLEARLGRQLPYQLDTSHPRFV